jgi:predicted amidophosphoribosyltransferase
MKCTYCDRENEDTDRHCRGCGAHLSVPVVIDEQAEAWEFEFNNLSRHLDSIRSSAKNWEHTATWVAVISIIEFFVIVALVGA